MHMQWQSIWGKLGQLTIQNIFCDLWVFYLCFAITLSQGFSITHLNTSMRPSLDAQARELDPWQKANAFIFQPTTKSTNTINYRFEGQLWDQFFCLVEERLKNNRDRLKSGKSGWKLRKWNRLFRSQKISRSKGTSEKVVLFSRSEFLKRKFCLRKAFSTTSFRLSRPFWVNDIDVWKRAGNQ